MSAKRHFTAWAISSAPFGVDLSGDCLCPCR
jgi:hypothetical protein